MIYTVHFSSKCVTLLEMASIFFLHFQTLFSLQKLVQNEMITFGNNKVLAVRYNRVSNILLQKEILTPKNVLVI